MSRVSKKNKTNYLLLTVCTLCVCMGGHASQVFPRDNSTVNYTHVYFQEKLVPGATEYELFLYTDSVATEPLFESKRAKKEVPAFLISDLKWATRYFWKIRAYDKNHQEISVSTLHRFNTYNFVFQIYDSIRVDVKTNKPDKHNGGLVAIDYTRSIYNREGRVVWTMPFIDRIVGPNTQIRDLRVTPENTITFLTIHNAVEIDLDGNLLWKAPSPLIINSDTINYHHDLKKTKRNTYMVLGEKKVFRRITGFQNKEEVIKKEPGIKMINNEAYRKTVISILLELDRNGKVIWYWDANDYITDADLNYKKMPGGMPNFSSHANAFGENPDGSKVYVGFRDLSRLVRIDKKSRKVDLSWGEKYPSGDAIFANSLFKNQHDANITARHTIYILNNNGAFDTTSVSSILELKENLTLKDNPVVWKFDLNFDSLSRGKSLNGGNVNELPNGNLLVCGGALNRIFEVTKSKEIVWDVFLLSKGKNDARWQSFPQYRSSWVREIKSYHCLPVVTETERRDGKISFNISVYNTGNSEDSYELTLRSEDGTTLYHKITPLVKADAVSEHTLTIVKSSKKPSRITVKSARSGRLTEMLIN